MPSSMTGFGRGTVERDGRRMTIELKSVNHRYLDPAFRMPRSIQYIEDTIKAVLSERISRGHVDVYVGYRNSRADARIVEVDNALLSGYLEAARAAGREFELTDDITLSSALRLPDVTNITEAEEDRDALNALAKEAANAAVDELIVMRAAEGRRLMNDLSGKIDNIKVMRDAIGKRAPLVVDEYKTRLTERIAVLLGQTAVDEARLAMEVAVFADKASIDEELVRLSSHTTQFMTLLCTDEPTGRKLDFVVQEMNREFNTIGSKANDAEITRLVIDGKAELEKIREQVQNLE